MDSDLPAINGIHLSAFGNPLGQEIVELVDGLLADETAKPLLSLVAETEEHIVGHVLFTKATLECGDRAVAARILAPLAVEKGSQAKGIGGLLIKEGLKRLANSGVELVFVLGYPEYYSRHGFHPAGALGFEAPFPISPAHTDAWMVQALRPGVVRSVQGRIRCAETLDEPRHWQE